VELVVLEISFGHPAELHEIAARVVWSREDEDPLGGLSMRRYGLQWQDLSSACVLRLRHIVGEASGEKRTGSHLALKPSPRLDAARGRGQGPGLRLSDPAEASTPARRERSLPHRTPVVALLLNRGLRVPRPCSGAQIVDRGRPLSSNRFFRRRAVTPTGYPSATSAPV
jgi:hypothetical protein